MNDCGQYQAIVRGSFSVGNDIYRQSEIQVLIVFAKDDLMVSFAVDLEYTDSILSLCTEGFEMLRGFEAEPGNCKISDCDQTIYPERLVSKDVPSKLLRVC